nr:MAG TPA: hypothetical protein [Bacteriophage sp.]
MSHFFIKFSKNASYTLSIKFLYICNIRIKY